uniref:Helicase-associated domain-containing protein n=1 Tax=Odontella aurita TaxID=265563 RepID=A0A7S4N2F7_9STRA|mmetsp:Transcript_44741/g.136511  ORF Transcript_44741/g.136511 Transcript_44741/m.136511 type:complete len:617 (+) Transcript_44741:49-1899(+)
MSDPILDGLLGSGEAHEGDVDDEEDDEGVYDEDEGEGASEDDDYEDKGGPEAIPSAPETVPSAAAWRADDDDGGGDGHDTESYASGDEKCEEDNESGDDEDEECTIPMAAVKTEAGETAADVSQLGFGPKADEAWLQRLRELYQYKAEFGDALVPQEYERNRGLGEWVYRQRVQYRNLTQGKPSNLTPERIRALHDVGFAFVGRGSDASAGRASTSPAVSEGPAPLAPSRRRTPLAVASKGKSKKSAKPLTAAAARNQDTWNLRLEQLREYYDEHSTFAVPQKYEQNPKLGYWVSEQRKQFMYWAKGKPSGLSRERMGLLYDIGFPLPKPPANQNPALSSPVKVTGAGDAWLVRLNELREYRVANGNYAVPQKYEKNPKLGYWVSEQRKQFMYFLRGKTSSMTQPRMRALFNIGFPWSMPKRPAGAGAKPASPPASGGSTVARSATAKSPSTGQRSSTGGAQTLQRGASTTGGNDEATVSCPGPRPSHGEPIARANAAGDDGLGGVPEMGAAVGPSVSAAASLRENEHAAASTTQDAWAQCLEELRLFHNEHGHCLVPQTYDLNRKLGLWVSERPFICYVRVYVATQYFGARQTPSLKIGTAGESAANSVPALGEW